MFFLHSQKVKKKFNYLENEKSFQDALKSIFHQFYWAVIEQNIYIFLEG